MMMKVYIGAWRMNRLNLVNQTFGRLIVTDFAYSKNSRSFWKCKCSCGNEKIILGKDLRNGHINSCGCLRVETSRKRMTTHGATYSRLYNIWCTMKQRCEHPIKEKHVKDYKNRGITVCAEWHDFAVFQKWAFENGYKDNLSIDRIDNNKGYYPENCRWADNITQANNKRNNVLITYNNKTQTIAQWARELGIKYNCLDERLRKGWSIEKAFTKPIQSKIKRG